MNVERISLPRDKNGKFIGAWGDALQQLANLAYTFWCPAKPKVSPLLLMTLYFFIHVHTTK